MRRNILLTIILFAAMLIAAPGFSQKVNQLTKKEQKEGWKLLFNGKDFDGWRQCNGTAMPKNWKIDDNAMMVFTAPDKKPGQGSDGDVIYKEKKYKNFEMTIDWKASKMANSGIFYNVREVPGKPVYYAAPEIQVLDNADATDNKLANHLAGSLYDLLPCDPKTVHPAGEWNTCVVKLKDGLCTQYMNGTEVVKYTLWTPEWDAMVAKSKFKSFPGWIEGIAKEGFIGLQDHGYAVWFRNIKIREL